MSGPVTAASVDGAVSTAPSLPAASPDEPGSGFERALVAAAGLFADRGYAATSVRDIAAAAGVAPATLYSHFGSKEEILAAIAARGYSASTVWARNVLLDLASQSAVAQLGALVHGYIMRSRSSPAMSCTVSTEIDRLRDDVGASAQSLRGELWELIVDVIRRGQARGEFATESSPYLMMTAIRGMGIQLSAGGWLRSPGADLELASVYRRFALRVVGAAP